VAHVPHQSDIIECQYVSMDAGICNREATDIFCSADASCRLASSTGGGMKSSELSPARIAELCVMCASEIDEERSVILCRFATSGIPDVGMFVVAVLHCEAKLA